MKRQFLLALVVVLALGAVPALASEPAPPVTKTYDDITLPAGGGFFWQPHVWDLTACDVTVSYDLDLSGAPNQAYYWTYGGPFAAANVGLVWPGSSWAGASMGGFLSDWDNFNTLFPIFPDKDFTQDLDDKFNMARFPNPGSWDELMYDVHCDPLQVALSPFGSYSNYGIWFDRDGVDQWQANMWGMVDGGTYNTRGVYEALLVYHKYSTTKGTACPLLFPTLPNDDAPGGYGIPTGFNALSPSGYADFPAGISFDTDEIKMAYMKVFVSGNPGDGTIIVKNLKVTGCLATIEVNIDVKPGSDPNSINLGSKGVVPVAVLTTDEFDASSVDPASVGFAGAAPVHWALEDVDGDGDVDMLFHFRTQELELDAGSTEASLTGQTLDEVLIEGTDAVNIVPASK